MKVIYPIIITEDKEDTVPFFVEIPALNGYTQGHTFAEAIEMARDYIGLNIMDRMDSKEEIPASIYTLPKVTEGTTTLVDVDIDAYKRKHDHAAIKKTLTIPRYLNEAGNEYGVNFSEILAEGIEKKVKSLKETIKNK
ncbi:type II toxin-antitoxin system HicB family antitoxin [Liquorilactobacillus mali]|uniref:HicB-like antitoxin of toxin-antitoxin system domain-containing protein n=1 Tax=Liquorilactobacillus mali TaxID=1618 RepID=A0A0R2FDM9_9LACO|nr:type II toxin-antitoxin system HicB family antitoxin [Liquorilactobacillus mali]KRN26579.1 hypothetical protein IV36_GL001817 [Liquorilactobacillus mali]